MMAPDFHVLEILKTAWSDQVLLKKWSLVFLPLILAFCSVFIAGWDIDLGVIETLTGALAIFVGFLFTLIIYISDKARNSRAIFESSDAKGEARKNEQSSYNRHKEYSLNLVVINSYTIIVAIVAICLMYLPLWDEVVSWFASKAWDCMQDWVPFGEWKPMNRVSAKAVFSLPAFIFLYHLIGIILLIMSGMFAFVRHEIDGVQE